MKASRQGIALALALSGTGLSVIGALINNLLLDPSLARVIWATSNPIMLILAIGNYRLWWNGGISMKAIICTYAVFTISNFVSFIL